MDVDDVDDDCGNGSPDLPPLNLKEPNPDVRMVGPWPPKWLRRRRPLKNQPERQTLLTSLKVACKNAMTQGRRHCQGNGLRQQPNAQGAAAGHSPG